MKADEDVTFPHVHKLTVPEAQALAERLLFRSRSTLFAASPEVRRDLCMASRAIGSLIAEVDKLASRCEDTAYQLRTLKIDVRGC
jgi:hypothetical protein